MYKLWGIKLLSSTFQANICIKVLIKNFLSTMKDFITSAKHEQMQDTRPEYKEF